jgi:hypothetical protein
MTAATSATQHTSSRIGTGTVRRAKIADEEPFA